MSDNKFTPDLGNKDEDMNNKEIGFNKKSELDIPLNSIGNSYYCQNCKATFVSTRSSAGVFCVFCGNRGLIKVDDFKYDSSIKVIPFVKSMDDAIKCYKRKVNLNFFLPTNFRSSEVIRKICKIYVPCALYDLNVSGNISFICCDEVDKKTNVPIKSYDVSYTTNFDYNGLLLSEFNKFNGKLLSSINNYELGIGIPFKETIEDVYYVKSNSDFNEVSDFVIKKAVNVVKDEINHKLKKVKKNEIKTIVNSKKMFLLPVYYLKTDYKGKEYYYLMNGQTGKSSIDIAISFSRVLLLFIIIFIIVFMISLLIAYIL